jgi:hypothetical protein
VVVSEQSVTRPSEQGSGGRVIRIFIDRAQAAQPSRVEVQSPPAAAGGGGPRRAMVARWAVWHHRERTK